jgi:hypothetical protein
MTMIKKEFEKEYKLKRKVTRIRKRRKNLAQNLGRRNMINLRIKIRKIRTREIVAQADQNLGVAAALAQVEAVAAAGVDPIVERKIGKEAGPKRILKTAGA